MENVVFDRAQLRRNLVELFGHLSVSEEDAAMVADTLIQADQWGVASHGILRVERYVQCLQSGGILPNAAFTVEKQVGGWVRATANGGLGIPASCKATELVIELAKEHGIGVVNLRQSHHNGAEGVYANAIAYAVPAGKYHTLMMDVAMSAVADGKVQLARAMGKELPPGCILDKDGKPSVIPEEYLNGGVLLPFGAHKGYGLSVMVECMAGILSGAALTHEINSWNQIPNHCGNTGHLFMAMDISRMMDVDAFIASVETMIGQFKSAKKMEGVEEIFYPGELEHTRKAKAGETVSVIPSTWESLCRAAKLVGVEPPCPCNAK